MEEAEIIQSMVARQKNEQENCRPGCESDSMPKPNGKDITEISKSSDGWQQEATRSRTLPQNGLSTYSIEQGKSILFTILTPQFSLLYSLFSGQEPEANRKECTPVGNKDIIYYPFMEHNPGQASCCIDSFTSIFHYSLVADTIANIRENI